MSLFQQLDKEQITVAAFLNFFVAWESFLEGTLTRLMSGEVTISGTQPTRYVVPRTQEAAKILVIGINKYFDYSNADFVRRMVVMYFKDGYPFEPHLAAISSDLQDLKTMRNSSAHTSSTTQRALESLAQRLFSIPKPGINLYTVLTSVSPASASGHTVFSDWQAKLLAVAFLIANG